MNKKIKNLFLAGLAIFSLAGVAVSCTDYDDDIDSLQDKTSSLEEQVSDLTTQLTQAQSDIESLQTALDNLETLAATHATKEELEAAVADLEQKIADAKTEAIASALEQAKEYANSLKDATDEQIDSIKNEISDLKDRTTAVETELTDVQNQLDSLKNAESLNSDAISDLQTKFDEAIARLGGKLKGLVFDAQVYVDGVPAIDVLSMDVNKVKIDSLDTENETPAAAGAASINGDVQANYYLNPSNATVTDAFDYSYILNQEGNTPFYVTRSKASDDFSITPAFNKSEDGILTLDLTVTGAPADSEYITIIKLQAKEGSDTAVVSNEHTLFRNIFDSVLVANKKSNQTIDTYKDVQDQHYRNNYYGENTVAINEIDGNAYGPVNSNAIYDKTYIWTEHIDTTLTKGSSLDLKGIAAAHAFKGGNETELTDEQMSKLHLTWDFSLVKYSFVDPQTSTAVAQDQSEYVVLDTTSLTVNTDKGFSVNGRTPIIRAILKHGDDNVAVGYIKIGIKVTDADVLKPILDDEYEETNTFLFNCDNDSAFVIATPQQLDSLAQRNGYSGMDSLIMDYPVLADEGTDAGSVYQVGDSIKWVIPMDSVWAHAGEVITRDIEFQNGDSSLVIPVTLKANVAEITKTFNLSSADGDYLDEYWWAADRLDSTKYEITKFNVRVPNVGEDTPDSCLFLNDLNAAFVTNNGRVVVSDDPTINKVDFFFCEKDLDGKEFTFGDTTVTFTVPADTILMVGNDTIATIDNSGSVVPYNVLKLNKNSNVAKRLLNTDALYTYIGARAYYCGKDN